MEEEMHLYLLYHHHYILYHHLYLLYHHLYLLYRYLQGLATVWQKYGMCERVAA